MERVNNFTAGDAVGNSPVENTGGNLYSPACKAVPNSPVENTGGTRMPQLNKLRG